jgi:prophage DNA circulation protein
MGLLNTRNLRKAKDLLEKNRHKVGDYVEKAGGTLDKVSKGKTTAVTAKASDAAKKYSQGAAPKYGTEIHIDDETSRTMSAEDAQVRQAQATEGAANAVKGAADALTNMMNKATAKAEEQNRAKRTES